MNRTQLQSMLQAHLEWLQHKPNGIRAQLSNIDLSEHKLRNRSMMQANMRGINLSNADLRMSSLAQAHLFEANLSNARMYEVNLVGADLRYANLSNADLNDADLRGAELVGSCLDGANLIGANLARINARTTRWDCPPLKGATIAVGYVCDGKFHQITNVGSEDGTLELYSCGDAGWYVKRGCYSGSVLDFLEEVEYKHGDNEHGHMYRAIIKTFCGVE